MAFRSFVLFFSAFLFSSLAHAQSFDGRYEGKLLLTQGADCGDKSEVFQAEVKGKTIRIFSPRASKPFEGTIRDNGQFFATDNYSAGGKNVTLEWRGQILATKTALGTAFLKSDGFCQFLLSLKRS
jgi:hypothetical protein